MSQTISCPRCSHVWDTSYQIYCKCPSCRVSISVPDGRAKYLSMVPVTAQTTSIPVRTPPPKPDPFPVVRDESGQPLQTKSSHERSPDKSRYIADDYAEINRRLKERKDRELRERLSRPLEG